MRQWLRRLGGRRGWKRQCHQFRARRIVARRLPIESYCWDRQVTEGAHATGVEYVRSRQNV